MNVSERVGGIRQVIAETLCAVPAAVASFAIKHISFQSVGTTASGFAMSRRNMKPWLIVVDERMALRGAHCLVAHEIAHAWLGHDGGDAVENELAACALVREWGFTGHAADGELQATYAIERRQPNTSKPNGSLRFEDDEVRMRCDTCGQDAELFVQSFDTQLRGRRTAELVARCPPERCDWFLQPFIPMTRCPRCEGWHLEATWLRRWWWPHLSAGRLDRVIRVLAENVASYVRGGGWPKQPPIIHLRCPGCGKQAMAIAPLAERAAMLRGLDELEKPYELDGQPISEAELRRFLSA